MDFQSAVKKCFRDYATFSGRSPRSEFWWWALFVFITSLSFSALDYFIFGTDTGAFSMIFALITLIPYIAVGSRRLHDINRSGWWQLIFLIPLIGFILMIIWFCKKSDEEPNQYGAPPL